MLEEKESLEEKLAISEYELRLAQEDILKLKAELQKKLEVPLDELNGNFSCLHDLLNDVILCISAYLYDRSSLAV